MKFIPPIFRFLNSTLIEYLLLIQILNRSSVETNHYQFIGTKKNNL